MNAEAGAKLSDQLGRLNGQVALTGPAGLAERRTYVRQLRLLFWGVLATAIALPPLFLQATSSLPGEHRETLILAEGMLFMVALVTLAMGRDATPFFEAGRFYSNTLPIRVLWAPRELGAFRTDEVRQVCAHEREFLGLALLEVTVESREGGQAVFQGFTRASLASEAGRDSVVAKPFPKGPPGWLGGGAEEVLAWAGEAGVALKIQGTANSP